MKTTVCGDDNAMLKIAICDDTTEERELVEQYARRYFQKQNRPVELETFPSMQDVLDTGTAYGLYLLDVLMPGKSGIQGAADLLKLYSGHRLYYLLPGVRGRQLPGLRLRLSVKACAVGGF